MSCLAEFDLIWAEFGLLSPMSVCQIGAEFGQVSPGSDKVACISTYAAEFGKHRKFGQCQNTYAAEFDPSSAKFGQNRDEVRQQRAELPRRRADFGTLG